jgi:hypothetical protein
LVCQAIVGFIGGLYITYQEATTGFCSCPRFRAGPKLERFRRDLCSAEAGLWGYDALEVSRPTAGFHCRQTASCDNQDPLEELAKQAGFAWN